MWMRLTLMHAGKWTLHERRALSTKLAWCANDRPTISACPNCAKQYRETRSCPSRMHQQDQTFEGSPLSASADLSICVGTARKRAGYNRPRGMILLIKQPQNHAGCVMRHYAYWTLTR